MITSISRKHARQIVETIRDVCGYDINFINTKGQIFASSNPERVGAYHEIGYRAARSGETIEVASDEAFAGTQKGINIPILHHRNVIAVVGISGEPDEVRRYARLAERIARLLLHEQELSEKARTDEEKRFYILQTMISGEFDNYGYYLECLREYGFGAEDEIRMICIEMPDLQGGGSPGLYETRIHDLFSSFEGAVYAFFYPNRYAGAVRSGAFSKKGYLLEKFDAEFASGPAEYEPDARRGEGREKPFPSRAQGARTAVGASVPQSRAARSWESACTAMDVLKMSGGSYMLFDDLTIEILLSGIPGAKRAAFSEKMLRALKEEERAFLRAYYEEDMSLAGTAGRLFLHKNTVQQRLNRIHVKTGYDPRVFRDAVLLYLALMCPGT